MTEDSGLPRALQTDGWSLAATRCSHWQFKHATKNARITVPGKPNDDFVPGTLNRIFKQSGLKLCGQLRAVIFMRS